MTYLRIHLIYLAIIGFLGFQYWTKTEALHHATESIEQLDRLLERNNVVVENNAKMITTAIGQQVRAYMNPRNMAFWEKTTNVTDAATTLKKRQYLKVKHSKQTYI